MSFVIFRKKMIRMHLDAETTKTNQKNSRQTNRDLLVCVCVCEDNVCDGHKLTNYPTERLKGCK
jgi:hypothetical protein